MRRVQATVATGWRLVSTSPGASRVAAASRQYQAPRVPPPPPPPPHPVAVTPEAKPVAPPGVGTAVAGTGGGGAVGDGARQSPLDARRAAESIYAHLPSDPSVTVEISILMDRDAPAPVKDAVRRHTRRITDFFASFPRLFELDATRQRVGRAPGSSAFVGAAASALPRWALPRGVTAAGASAPRGDLSRAAARNKRQRQRKSAFRAAERAAGGAAAPSNDDDDA